VKEGLLLGCSTTSFWSASSSAEAFAQGLAAYLSHSPLKLIFISRLKMRR